MIGFATLIAALKTGYRVRIAVRKPEDFERVIGLAPARAYVGQIERVMVPDITTPHAYDSAVDGVEYVIHVASPLPVGEIQDLEGELVTPARLGVIRMLEAASQSSGVKRIVFTASLGSMIAPGIVFRKPVETVFDGQWRNLFPNAVGRLNARLFS